MFHNNLISQWCQLIEKLLCLLHILCKKRICGWDILKCSSFSLFSSIEKSYVMFHFPSCSRSWRWIWVTEQKRKNTDFGFWSLLFKSSLCLLYILWSWAWFLTVIFLTSVSLSMNWGWHYLSCRVAKFRNNLWTYPVPSLIHSRCSTKQSYHCWLLLWCIDNGDTFVELFALKWNGPILLYF